MVIGLAMLASGCTAKNEGDAADGMRNCLKSGFDWSISQEWRLIVLDPLVSVSARSRFKSTATPFQPRRVEVTGETEDIRESDILAALSKKVGKNLAGVGISTTSEARAMEATFPEAAQAVYYRGVKAIEGTYTLDCPQYEVNNLRGRFFTWDVESPTTGLVDCLADSSENSQSALAKKATVARCPAGSPAFR